MGRRRREEKKKAKNGDSRFRRKNIGRLYWPRIDTLGKQMMGFPGFSRSLRKNKAGERAISEARRRRRRRCDEKSPRHNRGKGLHITFAWLRALEQSKNSTRDFPVERVYNKNSILAQSATKLDTAGYESRFCNRTRKKSGVCYPRSVNRKFFKPRQKRFRATGED